MVISNIIRILEYYYTHKKIIMEYYEKKIGEADKRIAEINRNIVINQYVLLTCFTFLIPLISALIYNNV